MNEKIDELLLLMQQGLPLVERPFAALGDAVGLGEGEVIAQTKVWFEEGKARRLGAIFDSRKLGYKSTLCGVDIPEDKLDEVTAELNLDTGITHGYLRGWSEELDVALAGAPKASCYPNYWFTYMAEADCFDADMAKLTAFLKPGKLLVLPALKRFKIDVIFDPRKKSGALFDGKKRGVKSGDAVKTSFSDLQKNLVRELQGNIELSPTPFEAPAQAAGITVSKLLMLLNGWKKDGTLRRFPLILRHHQIGFKANGMCVWNIPEDEIAEAGQKLASCRIVTHCYQRPVFDEFPYNLYAMIHSTAWNDTYEIFEEIEKETGLRNGKMFCSLKEFKKTSPVYFCKEEP